MVSIKHAEGLAELQWMQRQAGKRAILVSVPEFPWTPLAARVLVYEQEIQAPFWQFQSLMCLPLALPSAKK